VNWLDQIKWDEQGLVPAIAQETGSGKLLMMAWMNREALQLTAESGHAVYWSRSRGRLWHKGEESGHQQVVHAIRCTPSVSTATATWCCWRWNRKGASPATRAATTASSGSCATASGWRSCRY